MRRAAAALLAIGAAALAVLAAVAIYDHQTAHGEQPTLYAIRVVLYQYGAPAIAALIGGALVAGVLAFFVSRDRRWALVAAIVVAAAGIAAAWLGRHEIVAMEGRYAHKSPYVAFATRLAIAGTIYFATLAIAAVLALRRRS